MTAHVPSDPFPGSADARDDEPSVFGGELPGEVDDVPAYADSMRNFVSVVGRTPTTDAERWLIDGFLKWASGDNSLTLETCLRLPSTKQRRRRIARDIWLAEASSFLPSVGPDQAGRLLEQEFGRFLSRGPWLRWRDFEEPPVDAARMDRAMFFAAKFGGGKGLCARQLARIIGHRFRGQSRGLS